VPPRSQQLAELLGALAGKDVTTPGSPIRGAQVAVQPGAGGSRFARMVVVLPDGMTYAVQIEEV
jgi:hypothetical protein